jgi:hypothetical protein
MTLRLQSNLHDAVAGSSHSPQGPKALSGPADRSSQTAASGVEFLAYATDMLMEMRLMANNVGFSRLGDILLRASDEAEAQRRALRRDSKFE